MPSPKIRMEAHRGPHVEASTLKTGPSPVLCYFAGVDGLGHGGPGLELEGRGRSIVIVGAPPSSARIEGEP